MTLSSSLSGVTTAACALLPAAFFLIEPHHHCLIINVCERQFSDITESHTGVTAEDKCSLHLTMFALVYESGEFLYFSW